MNLSVTFRSEQSGNQRQSDKSINLETGIYLIFETKFSINFKFI